MFRLLSVEDIVLDVLKKPTTKKHKEHKEGESRDFEPIPV